MRRVLDSLGEPLLALDRSARILHVNAALRELLGWSRLELLGRPVELVIPGGLPGLPQVGPPVPPPGPGRPPPAVYRVSAARRDGQRQEVEVRLSPWLGGEAEGLSILSFHELDARVELERQLRLCTRLNMLDAALASALAPVMDEETAAYAALRACGETEGWELGTYWEMDPEEGVLRPLTVWTASSSLGGFVDLTLQTLLRPHEGLPGQAWARMEPVWCHDLAHDPHFLREQGARRQGLHGGLFTPVTGTGRRYGVLELFRREPLEDRAADEAMASALGHRFGRFLDRLDIERAENTRDLGLRNLWDSDLLGLFVCDHQGRLLDANAALLRMLGYTRQDVREGHLTWPGLMAVNHRAASEGALRRLRVDGTYHSFEGELLRRNAATVPAMLGSASLDEDRVVTFVLDLSDWKVAESGPRQEADARLQALIAYVPMVLFSMDRDGTFTLSEGQGLKALGLKPGQVVGLSVFDLYRSEPEVLAHVRRALAGEDFFTVDALSTGLLFETHWTPLRDAEGKPAGALGLALDVTQREREAHWRARLFHEAEQARAEAEQAVRARDEFLTVASHELKTPLTSLNLQLHTLLKRARQAGQDGEQVERLEKARRQLQKLARMMDELLDVSRVAEGRLRLELGEVDLLQVVQEVMERFQDEAQRSGTRLELRSMDAVVGQWDRVRLEQVVTNLVSNALKYGAGAPVDILVRSSGAMALLEVKDHGIGIAPEDLERIFGKFERAVPVRKYGGFGVGLYIVRQLVEALGGAVDVESTPGQGTTFHVVLPLAGPAARPTPSSQPEAGLH
ncbi:ATP-binding protein [Archangium sp.]|uniref:ATP-binding protein n=1 Tax=Archangium sp. TaxID=1872627 RepID=UPI002ED9053D